MHPGSEDLPLTPKRLGKSSGLAEGPSRCCKRLLAVKKSRWRMLPAAAFLFALLLHSSSLCAVPAAAVFPYLQCAWCCALLCYLQCACCCIPVRSVLCLLLQSFPTCSVLAAEPFFLTCSVLAAAFLVARTVPAAAVFPYLQGGCCCALLSYLQCACCCIPRRSRCACCCSFSLPAMCLLLHSSFTYDALAAAFFLHLQHALLFSFICSMPVTALFRHLQLPAVVSCKAGSS